MSIDTLERLFEHGLEDIYYAEHELLDVLEELAEQTEGEELTQAFQDHHEETEGQIDRLEEVFDMIGEPPEEEECEGIQGLVEEHENFLDEDPSQEILDLYNKTAAEKTEHYEIAAYGNLAYLADKMGMDEAGDLLHENLEEEKQTLEKLKEISDNMDYEAMME